MVVGQRVEFADLYRAVVRGTVREIKHATLRGVDLGYDNLLIEVDAEQAIDGDREEWITSNSRGLRAL